MSTRRVSLVFAAAVLATAAAPARGSDRPPLRDAPVVWWEDDASISITTPPVERDPSIPKDQFTQSVVRPLQRNTRFSSVTRRVGSWFGGDHMPPAANVNALDEVPNSTWFTNRIGMHAMSPEEAARGVGEGDGPDTSGPWTVVSAKTEGVTPGFNIKDAKGDVYLIKFDPLGYPGVTSVPGAIVVRALHAAGYNVPEDAIVTFPKDRLVLGEGVKIKEADAKRAMTEADLDAILARVDRVESGEYLAISSKFLSGKPLGPFDYKGTRKDDPNDRIRHEQRRELRGFRVFAAWLHHFDTKQHNSLDMLVEENGRTFVRHYLIDFASTLGAGASGPKPKYGREYGFDVGQVGARMFALGLLEDDWRRVEAEEPPPELANAVGYYDVEYFDPKGFKPLLPNSSFASLTDRDGYWAAKIVTAFTDEHLEAIGRGVKAPNPSAAEFLVDRMKGRRDVIGREWFARVAPADFFRAEGGGAERIVARDLGVERGLWKAAETKWRMRCAVVDSTRDAEIWSDEEEIPVDAHGVLSIDCTRGGAALALKTADTVKRPFIAVELAVDRGEGWGESVTAYVARLSGRVVAVDR